MTEREQILFDFEQREGELLLSVCDCRSRVSKAEQLRELRAQRDEMLMELEK